RKPDDLLWVLRSGGLRHPQPKHVHSLVTRVLEAGYESETVVRQRGALGDIVARLLAVEIFGVVRHAGERAPGGDERLAPFRQREFSVGVDAMQMNRSFEHINSLPSSILI